jgi:hypothetical protein
MSCALLTFYSYTHWGTKAPRGFSADLFLMKFISDQLGRADFDVLTDHDISNKPSILTRYDVLISSTHPEYVTSANLDCIGAFMNRGGRFMYLGGNGYYWVTAHIQAQSHLIEVRRGQSGCRSFELGATDRFHSLTGEQGGLWRDRGRAPNEMFGIGSVACSFYPGTSYVINTAARRDRDLQFLFANIPHEQQHLGHLGLFERPASGDEIDCMSDGPFEQHNDSRATILATTRVGAHHHSDDYRLFPEEAKFPIPDSHRVRSDVVLSKGNSGGMVFSVGSMDWVGHPTIRSSFPLIDDRFSRSLYRAVVPDNSLQMC